MNNKNRKLIPYVKIDDTIALFENQYMVSYGMG